VLTVEPGLRNSNPLDPIPVVYIKPDTRYIGIVEKTVNRNLGRQPTRRIRVRTMRKRIHGPGTSTTGMFPAFKRRLPLLTRQITSRSRDRLVDRSSGRVVRPASGEGELVYQQLLG
jgi:hypothetical protein